MKWFVPIGVMTLVIYLNNSSSIRGTPEGNLEFLAHRGVHQTYPKENLSAQGCTADRINEPEHQFLENTVESIRRAFETGAKIVEIDIHPTKDRRFAVFHDWTLECRTNGEGVTREQTLAYLKSLDVGYGYTHDGESYPFRGKAVGKMPSLTEVLDAFPHQKFLINIKSNDPAEADLLAYFIDNRPNENLSRLSFYGAAAPTSRLLSLNSELRGFTPDSVKKCAIRYQLLGWTGYVPQACRSTIVAIPIAYVDYVWGWPSIFVSRMDGVGTSVILIDMEDGHTDGIDDLAIIRQLSKNYRGLVWTDKIEHVSKALR